MTATIPRRLAAEFIGTIFLLATVVGSGIMGDNLADGNEAIALLGNSIATGAILVVLILVFGPISSAHFNPAVTFAYLLRREISLETALAYMATQIIAGVTGTIAAHIMFAEPILTISTNTRAGLGLWIAEFIATFGLLATILGCVRFRPDAVPYAVGLFITAGYWFTASTSFANPAVTIARTLTNTFTGISPMDAPAFIAAQIIGSITATVVLTWLFRSRN